MTHYVYGDKVQVVATGERAKINCVFAETYQVEYTTGELQEMRPDELEPAAPPPAAASDDAPSRERLAAITARVAEYERQMKTRLSDADISPMDAEEAADMLGGLAYIKSEQIAALESALAAAESDRDAMREALEPFVDAAVQDDKRVAMGHIHDVSAINDVEYVDIRFVDERRNFSEYRLKKQSLANVLQAAANLRKQTPTATADAANALADGGE